MIIVFRGSRVAEKSVVKKKKKKVPFLYVFLGAIYSLIGVCAHGTQGIQQQALVIKNAHLIFLLPTDLGL